MDPAVGHDQAGDGELTLTLRAGPAYRLTRTAGFAAPDALRLRYTLTILAAPDALCLGRAPPDRELGWTARSSFRPGVTEVINTIPESWGWGPPETRFDWPERWPWGRGVRLDKVGPPELRKGRKLFAMPRVRPSWAAVLRRESGHWLRFEWNPSEIPYLGLWVDEGALNHESVAAPEPTTGWYDDLALHGGKGKSPPSRPAARGSGR